MTTFAFSVTIKADHTYNTSLKPIVVEGNLPDTIRASLNHIEGTKVYKGSCDKTSTKLNMLVACLTYRDSNLHLTVPNSVTTFTGGNYQLPSNPTNEERIGALNWINSKLSNSSNSPFNTKLAYVSKHKNGLYNLRIAHYDGSGTTTLLQSKEPILSPAWSPNGRYISYVSYETFRPSIFVIDAVTKLRVKVLSIKGLNAYPEFSSNESLLVSVSNQTRKSDIHEINIVTKQITNLQKSETDDIFPKKFKNKILKVGLSKNGTPYTYSVEQNQTTLVSKRPLNSIDISHSGDLIGLRNKDLIHVYYDKDKWVENGAIASGNNIESPSINNAGNAVYYVNKENNNVFINMASIRGKNLLSFSVKDEDLIQVTAY